MGEPDANGEGTGGTLRAVVLAIGLVIAAAIAAWTLVNIWRLAHPSGVGTVCPLIYPPPPGCWPQGRFTPAFVSAVVVSLGYSAVTFLLLTVGRRRVFVAVWALGGLAILGILASQFVTWGGMPG
ncbi:hypothetical protein [Promicromonospora soli]